MHRQLKYFNFNRYDILKATIINNEYESLKKNRVLKAKIVIIWDGSRTIRDINVCHT